MLSSKGQVTEADRGGGSDDGRAWGKARDDFRTAPGHRQHRWPGSAGCTA